jgi:predicted nucleic acid-binding Zn ribbon protein
VCNASPVELVLYPVAIHYKGSGFYSTDYGKGAKKKDGSEAAGGESKPETKTETKTDSKPAETAPKPKPAPSGD